MPVLARSHPLPSSRIVHDRRALAPPFPSQNDRGYINLYVATYSASDPFSALSFSALIDSVQPRPAGWLSSSFASSQDAERKAKHWRRIFAKIRSFLFFFFLSRFYAVSILKQSSLASAVRLIFNHSQVSSQACSSTYLTRHFDVNVSETDGLRQDCLQQRTTIFSNQTA